MQGMPHRLIEGFSDLPCARGLEQRHNPLISAPNLALEGSRGNRPGSKTAIARHGRDRGYDMDGGL